MRKLSRPNVSGQVLYQNKGNVPLFGWVILGTYKFDLASFRSHFRVDCDARCGVNFAALRGNGVLQKDGRRM